MPRLDKKRRSRTPEDITAKNLIRLPIVPSRLPMDVHCAGIFASTHLQEPDDKMRTSLLSEKGMIKSLGSYHNGKERAFSPWLHSRRRIRCRVSGISSPHFSVGILHGVGQDAQRDTTHDTTTLAPSSAIRVVQQQPSKTPHRHSHKRSGKKMQRLPKSRGE